MTICWKVKNYVELGTAELYDILRLRNAVYIVELKCPVGDTDGEDLNEGTSHLMGYHQETGRLVAYLRMNAVDDGKVKIRRVVVAKEFRGNGVARTLMTESMNWCKSQEVKCIVLAARVHLREFYKSLGFLEVSKDYYLKEVGVWHVDMELSF